MSGPGVVQGSHNGDVHCQEPNNAPWHTANHGLVRGVIRVTSTAGRAASERALLSQIDSIGPMAASTGLVPVEDEGATAIVVEASSPGLAPVQVSIPVSTDAASASVMAVAQAGAGLPVDFFGHATPPNEASY